MLLDTHVWLWGAGDDTRQLGPRTRRLLNREATRGRLYVSTISMFELAALHLAGRLQLALPVETWIRESIQRNSLRITEVTGTMAVDAGLIPAAALADPFDRLLVASARQLAVPFVTRDRRILGYAGPTGAPRVIDAAA